MYDTQDISLPYYIGKIFHFLIFLYPKQYRKHYGREMYLTFHDICQGEVVKNGKLTTLFWLVQLTDITKSIINEHIDEIQKIGMRKYIHNTFHINRYNIIGGILLLPICIMILIDLVARIAQRDLTHYNRPVYAFLSHNPLYYFPILFTWVILFPTLAVVINLIPFVQSLKREHTYVSLFRQNIIAMILVGISVLFLLSIKLHDAIPCILHGFILKGLGQFFSVLSFCRNV